ncbi:hypothetical protein NLY09_10615 (plasmid) [Burkholderia vietnamiensis]
MPPHVRAQRVAVGGGQRHGLRRQRIGRTLVGRRGVVHGLACVVRIRHPVSCAAADAAALHLLDRLPLNLTLAAFSTNLAAPFA